MIGPSDSSRDFKVSSVNTVQMPGQDVGSVLFRSHGCSPVLRDGQQAANDKHDLYDQYENQQAQSKTSVDAKQPIHGVWGEEVEEEKGEEELFS